ncbi:MFS transporter [Arcicella aquatica]|uniref:MFS transporter n=1 Tax=Arcicella aquatica TaxID=217141 RepID=A0ABU5QS33_9BACT|nr:MFS transporter [Arcicella aquatica]MEA5259905.1 MFS transporter [Arcicella aquatica]
MKKRHQVLLVLAILSVITFLDRIAFSTAGERITKELGLSPVQWGWILGSFTLAYALFEVPTGLLGDKIGAKSVLIRVVLWWSFFTVLTGFSTGFVMLLGIRFLFGIGEAGAYPNIAIALAKWFPANERGQAQAIIWGASRLGAGLTPLVVIPIQQRYGWEASFYVLGFVGVIWVIFWYFWHKEDPTQAKDISKSELDEILAKRQLDNHADKVPFRKFLKSKNLWFLMGMYACYATGIYFFQTWLPKYLQQGRGVSEDQLKYISSIAFLLAAFGCFMGGFISDILVKKYGKKWGRRIVPMTGMGISGIFLIISALTVNNTVAIVLLSLGMAFMDVTAPVAWAVSMDIGGNRSGSISGAMNSAGLLVAYLNTVSFGYLVTNFGYNFPVLLLGVIVIIGAFLWLKINAEETIEYRL